MTLEQATQWLWQGGLGVVPAAVAALLVVKLRWIRPATKHLLCVSALGCLLAAPLLAAFGPRLPTFSWLTAQRTSSPEAQQRRADASQTKTDHTLRRNAKRDVDHDSDRAAAAHEAALPRRPYPWRSWPEDAQLFDAPEPLWVRPLPPPTPLDALRDDAGERRLAGAPPSEAAALALSESAQDFAAWPVAPSAALDLDIDIETRAFSPATDQTPPSQAAAPDAAAVSPPAPAPAPAEEAGPATIVSGQLEALRAWGPWLGLFVEALRSAPPLPTALWLGGSALTLALLLVQTQRGRRLVAAAAEAPPSFQAEVDCAARRLGLSRAPIVRMTQLRVSPLIWCGRKPVLLLPEPLWSSLSREQRDAILLHELAHLKRRDHLLRWADAATAVAYWWHPLVWLLRRQVREQADLSCDAWVTALLPHRRTAYARALIQTKAFLSSPSTAGSAFALSAASSRTRRFTRRLTMVMLHRTRPGASLAGMLAALSVAALGLTSAPLLATSPADDEAAAAVHPHPEQSKEEQTGKGASEQTAPSEGETTFEKYLQEVEQDKQRARERARAKAQQLAQRARARAEQAKKRAERMKRLAQRSRVRVQQRDCDMDDYSFDFDDLEGLQDRLSELRRRMSDMDKRLGMLHFAPDRFRFRFHRGVPRSAAPWAHRSDCRCCCCDDDAGRIHRHGEQEEDEVVVAPDVDARPHAPAHEQHGEAAVLVEREYHLSSPGKLAVLTRLMAREDVPIRIEPDDDAITVIATPRQQRVFAAFVRMIDPESSASPAEERAVAPRSPRSPRHRRSPRSDESDSVSVLPETREGMRLTRQMLQEARAALQAQAERLAVHAKELSARRSTMRQALDAIQNACEAIEDRADDLEDLADDLEDKADDFRDQAADLVEQASDAENAQARSDALAKAQRLRAAAEKLETEAHNLLERSKKLTARREELQTLAEQLQERMDAVNERMEEAIERFRQQRQHNNADKDADVRKSVSSLMHNAVAEALAQSGALLDRAASALARTNDSQSDAKD